LEHCYWADRNGRLRYFGHSGTGFSERGLKEAIDRLKPLFIDNLPVENPPKIPERIQWVQPKLVCEVAYAEWTLDGELRQTTFLGWRDDKSPDSLGDADTPTALAGLAFRKLGAQHYFSKV